LIPAKPGKKATALSQSADTLTTLTSLSFGLKSMKLRQTAMMAIPSPTSISLMRRDMAWEKIGAGTWTSTSSTKFQTLMCSSTSTRTMTTGVTQMISMSSKATPTDPTSMPVRVPSKMDPLTTLDTKKPLMLPFSKDRQLLLINNGGLVLIRSTNEPSLRTLQEKTTTPTDPMSPMPSKSMEELVAGPIKKNLSILRLTSMRS